MAKAHELYCSFCGKNQDEVATLIAGPTVFICDECVVLCTEILGAKNIDLAKRAEDERQKQTREAVIAAVGEFRSEMMRALLQTYNQLKARQET